MAQSTTLKRLISEVVRNAKFMPWNEVDTAIERLEDIKWKLRNGEELDGDEFETCLKGLKKINRDEYQWKACREVIDVFIKEVQFSLKSFKPVAILGLGRFVAFTANSVKRNIRGFRHVNVQQYEEGTEKGNPRVRVKFYPYNDLTHLVWQSAFGDDSPEVLPDLDEESYFKEMSDD